MRGNRREFLWQAGLGVAAGLTGAWVTATTAWADRLRILGGPGSVPGRETPDESVIARGRVSPDLQRFLGHLRVGIAQGQGVLRVLWLHRASDPSRPGPVVLTFDEARAAGALLITERDQASVPELIVENRGKSFVLLLAGEILIGGKQNRVLAEDILLPPRSGPRLIGVYCVEQGRWAGSAKGFDTRGSFAAPGLRARLMERADQGRVWAEVDQYTRSAAAASPTRSYQEIYEKAEVQDHLAKVERGIDTRPPAEALGAAVFAGDALTGLDLFEDASLFAREWPKLLRAQAIEVYRRPGEPGADERRLRGRVEELLATAAKVEGTLRGSPGVGQIFEVRFGGFRATPLIVETQIVHLALL